MQISTDFKMDVMRHIDPEILAEALILVQALIAWGSSDIFDETHARPESTAQANNTCPMAYKVLKIIAQTVKAEGRALSHRADCILDEAEEAFGARSLAKERAANGSWGAPETITDYLFWIEDEAILQEKLGEDPTYFKALHGVADEIRALGFEPTLPL